MHAWKFPLALGLLAAALGAAAVYRAEANRSEARLAEALREIARLRAPAPASPEPADSGAPARDAALAPPSDGTSDPDILLGQIRELEQLLQEPEAATDSHSQGAGESAAPTATPQNPGNWMEDLRRTDPARYEEVVRRREQARQELLAARAEQSDFFRQRAEEAPAEDEQTHYRQMAQILDSTWQMMEMLRTELPAEQRRELQGAIRDNLRTLSPMLAAERNKEWRRLGLELGASPAESQAVADRINQVLRVTNTRYLLRQRGGPSSRAEPRRAP